MSESTGDEEERSYTAADRFQGVFHQFAVSMEAVGELKDFATEHVRQLDDVESGFQRLVTLRMPDAPPEQHRQATAIVKRGFEEIDSAHEASAGDGESEPPETTAIMERMQLELGRVLDHPHAFVDYLVAYFQARFRPARVPVMHASLLTTAVGSFEVLISGIVREFLRLKPEVLRTDDAKYSMADVEGFESLEEFREHCTERYAETLLRGSFEDWMAWFDKRLKIKLADLTDDPVHVREVFQRRHLFVHNGGVVNRSYLVKMPDIDPAPRIGQQLEIDEHYLARAIDSLTAVGALLMIAVMRRLLAVEPDQTHKADKFASNTSFEHLQHQRWDLVIKVTSGAIDGCISDYERLLMMVNRWLAQKRLRGVEAIRAEVDSWQVAPLSPKFRLAKLALLDEVDEASELATKLVEMGEIDQGDLLGWPLLKEVRAFRAAQMAADENQPAPETFSSGGPGDSSPQGEESVP